MELSQFADRPVPWAPVTPDAPGAAFEPRPPKAEAYDVPDTECDGWSVGGLVLRSASVRGAKQRYYGRPRQDAVRAAAHESSGTVAFAVADGVSSARSAELGALEACRAAVEMLLHQLSGVGVGAGSREPDFRVMTRHVSERLYELAQWRLGVASRPVGEEVANLYATTLVAGIVRPDPQGAVVQLCRIGNSGAWILDRFHGRYQALFGSHTGSDAALAANEVRALPLLLPDSLQCAQARLSSHTALLVGTDGFGDPLGDGAGQVGTLFARHLAQPPAAKWLAHILDFSRESCEDDRTLLTVFPRDPREAAA